MTTYQDQAELAGNWRFIADRLARGGTAVVSFSNRAALDHAVRTTLRIAKPIIKEADHKKGLFGQAFAIFAYRPAKVAEMARSVGFRIARLAFLNQTVSPFNTLLPTESVPVAQMIERHAPTELLPLLSAVRLRRAGLRESAGFHAKNWSQQNGTKYSYSRMAIIVCR